MYVESRLAAAERLAQRPENASLGFWGETSQHRRNSVTFRASAFAMWLVIEIAAGIVLGVLIIMILIAAYGGGDL